MFLPIFSHLTLITIKQMKSLVFYCMMLILVTVVFVLLVHLWIHFPLKNIKSLLPILLLLKLLLAILAVNWISTIYWSDLFSAVCYSGYPSVYCCSLLAILAVHLNVHHLLIWSVLRCLFFPKRNFTKFRAILNLSAPVGFSVNDFIDRDCFSMHYSGIDDAIFHLTQLGAGALMSKLDIKSAFRLIPVHPSDWPLLGYCIDSKFYYDIVLPFRLRSSPYLLTQKTTACSFHFA